VGAPRRAARPRALLGADRGGWGRHRAAPPAMQRLWVPLAGGGGATRAAPRWWAGGWRRHGARSAAGRSWGPIGGGGGATVPRRPPFRAAGRPWRGSCGRRRPRPAARLPQGWGCCRASQGGGGRRRAAPPAAGLPSGAGGGGSCARPPAVADTVVARAAVPATSAAATGFPGCTAVVACVAGTSDTPVARSCCSASAAAPSAGRTRLPTAVGRCRRCVGRRRRRLGPAIPLGATHRLHARLLLASARSRRRRWRSQPPTLPPPAPATAGGASVTLSSFPPRPRPAADVRVTTLFPSRPTVGP